MIGASKGPSIHVGPRYEPQLPTLVLPTPLARAKVNALLDQVVVVGHVPQQPMGLWENGLRVVGEVWKVRLNSAIFFGYKYRKKLTSRHFGLFC